MKSFRQEPDEMEEFLGLMEEDVENVQRVMDFCRENDLDVHFEIHPKAETVDESVQHSPVEKSQIVKTLVFRAGEEFLAVLTPGDKRVDTDKLEEVTGEDVRMANPNEVEQNTGYVVGGVSPFDLEIPVYMEESLLEHDEVRPAAGSRVIGAEVSPEELKKCISAEVRDLKI